MRRMMIRLGCVLVAAALMSACASAPTSEPSGPAEPSPTAMASPVSTATATASGRCVHTDMAVDRGPYVIAGIEVPGFFPNMGPPGWKEDDLALRQVVIVGRVVAEEPAAFGGQAYVYTPFAVEVERVIHGNASLGRSHVSIEGGTVGCYEVRVDTVPALHAGARYVLFLTGPVGTNPPPGVWDVWMVDDQDVVWTYQGPMPLAELIDRIDRLSAAQSSPTP